MHESLFYATQRLTKKEGKLLPQKVNKLFEEGGELARATLIFESAPGTKYRNIPEEEKRNEVKEEIADCVIVLMSISQQEGLEISYFELCQAINEKMQKWEAKMEKEFV